METGMLAVQSDYPWKSLDPRGMKMEIVLAVQFDFHTHGNLDPRGMKNGVTGC
jgi:hypothetical protein